MIKYDKEIIMHFSRLLLLLCLCFVSSVFATAEKLPIQVSSNLTEKLFYFLPTQQIKSSNDHQEKIKHVIYITLDGVRWQDIFVDRSHLKIFWSKYAQSMKIYGDPMRPGKIEVASIPISLPSYQSQMSGAVQPCQDNFCGRINVETFPEKLIKSFGFKKKDVAIFASWSTIANATEHEIGKTFTNAGNKSVYDPDTGVADQVMQFLNSQQMINHENLLDRSDLFTFAQAMHYFEKYQPRFLWISLTDADAAAHLKSRGLYDNVLELYDRLLHILFHTLDILDLSDETAIIITTDHGRGNGKHWTDHGPKYPESKQTWAFAKNADLVPMQGSNYWSTLSIRPTIEAILKSEMIAEKTHSSQGQLKSA